MTEFDLQGSNGGYKAIEAVNSTASDPFIINGQGFTFDNHLSTASYQSRSVRVYDALTFYNGTLRTGALHLGDYNYPSTHDGYLVIGSSDSETTLIVGGAGDRWPDGDGIRLWNGAMYATNLTLVTTAGSNNDCKFRIGAKSDTSVVVEKVGGDWTSAGMVSICVGTNSTASVYHRSGSWTVSNYLVVGHSANGVNHAYFEISGGAVTNASYNVSIGDQDCEEASTAQMRVTGDGEYYSVPSRDFFVGTRSSGELTVDGNGRVTVNRNLKFADNANFTSTETATVNLNGGTIAAKAVTYGSGLGQATFNFNGGTLKALAAGDFIAAYPRLAVNVCANGGMVDANGYDITIAEDLASVAPQGATDGGMTFKGGSTVTLSGAVGYTGATTVELGTTVVVSNAASIAQILASGLKASCSASTTNGVYTILTRADGGTFTIADLDNCSTVDSIEPTAFTFSLSDDQKSVVATYEQKTYTWSGNAGDGKFATAGNWSVGGSPATKAPNPGTAVVFANSAALTVTLDADAEVPSVAFNGTAAVTFANPDAATTNTLTVASLSSTGAAGVTHTFNCAVKFADTYDVDFTNPVTFAGGVTSTYPDADVASRGEYSHLLQGRHVWTKDWTVPVQTTPFVVADGSTLVGKAYTGASGVDNLSLRISDEGYAEFDSVFVGVVYTRVSVWGTLKVNGVYYDKSESGTSFVGYNNDNNHNSKIIANGIHTYRRTLYMKVKDVYIGSDGLQMQYRYGSIVPQFCTNIHFTADCLIKGGWHSESAGYHRGKDYEWGFSFQGDAEFDTGDHTVTWDAGISANADGYTITKSGSGTLVMIPNGLNRRQYEDTQLVGANMSRDFRISAGTVVLSNDVNIVNSGKYIVESGATLNIANTNFVSKVIGTGNIALTGNSLAVSGSDLTGFTGTVTVDSAAAFADVAAVADWNATVYVSLLTVSSSATITFPAGKDANKCYYYVYDNGVTKSLRYGRKSGMIMIIR